MPIKSMLTKTFFDRFAVWIILGTINFICVGCADGIRRSTCEDPINERHRGLQWLSSGSLGQHLAIDFVAHEGTEVRAIADGHIEKYYPDAGYYGGCDGTPGPVIITRHPGGSQGSYAVQYGHVKTNLNENDVFRAGEVIGTVINFIPCCDIDEGCPHLHFAIWDAATEHPLFGMGYGDPRSFVDPDWFFENDLCLPSADE